MISDIQTRPYQLAAAPWVDLVSPLKHKSRLRGSGLRSVARFTDLPTPTSGAHSSTLHSMWFWARNRAHLLFVGPEPKVHRCVRCVARTMALVPDSLRAFSVRFFALKDAVVVSGGVIEGHCL